MPRTVASRRRALGLVATMALLPLVQACAPAAAPTPTPAAAPAPAKPSDAAKPTAAPAAAPAQAAGKTTVRYGTYIGLYQATVDLFNKKSEKVNVVLEANPFQGYADKLAIDIAGGTAPDVFNIPSPGWIAMMRKKLTYPVDDLLKRGNLAVEDFLPDPRKRTLFEGQLWGLPFNSAFPRGMAYNQTLFEKAGAKLPTDEWTWEDVTAAAQKIHKPPDAFAMTATRHTQVLMQSIVRNGGKILSDDEQTYLVDSPEAIEAIQPHVDWLVKHKVAMAPGEERALGDKPFASGKIGLTITPIGDWRNWRDNLSANLSIPGDVVHWPNPPKVKNDVVVSECHVAGMARNTKVVDQAWEYLRFALTDVEANKIELDFWPVSYRSEKSLDLVSDARQRAFLKKQVDSTKKFIPDFWGVKATAVQNAFLAEYDLALLGKKPVPDAMRDAAKAMKAAAEG